MSMFDELEAIRKAVYGDGPIIMESMRNRPIGDIPGIPSTNTKPAEVKPVNPIKKPNKP
jgi:hypothetical protein